MDDGVWDFYIKEKKIPGTALSIREFCSYAIAPKDELLEKQHNYIQYVFPSDVRSSVEPKAPLLTREMAQRLSNESEFRHKFEGALTNMMNFYGIILLVSTQKVYRNPRRNKARIEYFNKSNHDHKRISRILRCVSMIPGYEKLHSIMEEFFVNRLRCKILLPGINETQRAIIMKYWKGIEPYPKWCGDFITRPFVHAFRIYAKTREEGEYLQGDELDLLARIGLPASYAYYELELQLCAGPKVANVVRPRGLNTPNRAVSRRNSPLPPRKGDLASAKRNRAQFTSPLKQMDKVGNVSHTPSHAGSVADPITISDSPSKTAIGNSALTEHDKAILAASDSWLSTGLADLYVRLLNENSIDRDRVYALQYSSYEYYLRGRIDSSRKARWRSLLDTRKDKIAMMVVPILIAGNHWILGVVAPHSFSKDLVNGWQCRIYDPLQNEGGSYSGAKEGLKRFALELFGWKGIVDGAHYQISPQQTDGHNCGFMCMAVANAFMNAGKFRPALAGGVAAQENDRIMMEDIRNLGTDNVQINQDLQYLRKTVSSQIAVYAEHEEQERKSRLSNE